MRRNALVTFSTVPSSPIELPVFDHQVRTLFAAAGIAEALEANPTVGMNVCKILAKHEWTLTDRTALMDAIETLYGDLYGG